jgi:predicted negative regulator of RcsB-dependent stress response
MVFFSCRKFYGDFKNILVVKKILCHGIIMKYPSWTSNQKTNAQKQEAHFRENFKKTPFQKNLKCHTL